MQEKSLYEYVHSVRIELAKLILVGTRITYQATGDAGYYSSINTSRSSMYWYHTPGMFNAYLYQIRNVLFFVYCCP